LKEFFGLDRTPAATIMIGMIICKVYTKFPGEFLGDLKFATLPMIGHQVFLPSNVRHRVEEIWHQPHGKTPKTILIVSPAETP
jgi:hypothetical protein